MPAVATLVLAGPRVSEMCKLEEPGIDLAETQRTGLCPGQSG